MTPTLSDRYRLEGRIGSGAFADVFRAYDHRTHSLCAIKVLRTRRLNRAAIQAFSAEVETMSRIRHPHLLPVYDHDLSSTTPWMAMPLVRGGSVAEHLRVRGALPVGDVLVHGLELLGALHHAHTKGLIHADVKPANLLKAPNGVLLADFGVRALLGDTLLEGSMGFVASDWAAEGAHPRLDLFAAGVTLFQMATNGNPFDLKEDPIDGPRFRRVPTILRPVVHRATRTRDTAPYSTARELANDLLQSSRSTTFEAAADEAFSRSF